MFDINANIKAWSDYLREKGQLKEADLTEMEEHLRDEIEDLKKAGLSEEEAFLISVKRFGNINQISGEFSKLSTESFWKQLVVDEGDASLKQRQTRNILLVISFSLIAGTLAKVPQIFGLDFLGNQQVFYLLKNLSLFIFPLVAIYFMVNHPSSKRRKTWILIIFVLTALLINVYPYQLNGSTIFLTSFHLPIFLWLVVGVAYLGDEWKSSRKRMDFLRLTGETFIYGVLVFCGLLVFNLFTIFIFSALNIDLSEFMFENIMVYGSFGVMMIAVYLAEAKKSIIENFAPILAKIFSPLFLVTMIAFLISMVLSGKTPFLERNYLIGFDFMLVLVLGLVLYVISSRKAYDKPNLFDGLNFALILTALAIDAIALSAILFRLSTYGITPNKIAALGENLILFVNLGGLAWLYVLYLRGKIEFAKLERFQTEYLCVFAGWTAVVALLFPLLFGFI